MRLIATLRKSRTLRLLAKANLRAKIVAPDKLLFKNAASRLLPWSLLLQLHSILIEEETKMDNMVEAPQDSVLRRHWQSSREIQADSVQPQENPGSSEEQQQGFFSWLKSIFS